MLHSKSLLYILAAFAVKFSETLSCWECNNAQSDEQCISSGKSVNCTGEQEGCLAEIRYHSGVFPPILITKRCKQELACDRSEFQNDKGGHPFQCNPKIPESLCRCCCSTSDCNKAGLGCLPDYPECRQLKAPKNGEMECKYDATLPTIGEECRFNCRDGFELLGKPVLECLLKNEKTAAWNHREPTCRLLKCGPEYTDLSNGEVECTRGNFVFSTCTFRCHSGHKLEGQDRAICDSSQNWSAQPPKCIEITCTPTLFAPVSGKITCTKGNRLGSVCSFSCNLNHVLIGSSATTCTGDDDNDAFGRWSESVPRCGLTNCQPQSSTPANGEVFCTDGNNKGSVCFYTCHVGYALDGSSSRNCVDDGDGDEFGEWSDKEPFCQRVKCPPPHLNLVNGKVTCTDQYFEGSVCTFSCDEGYEMSDRGQVTSECENDGDGDAIGRWSRDAPYCSTGQCSQLYDPINGQMDCSNTNAVRSSCRFVCDEGFYMRSAAGIVMSTPNMDVVCSDLRQWSQRPPTCEPISCNPPHRSDELRTVTCTDENNFGSICTWECKDGQAISGQIQSECRDNGGKRYGKWEPPLPVNTCEKSTCVPLQISPQNGNVRCTDETNTFSVCTFACLEGYYLVDSEEGQLMTEEFSIDCQADGSWSSERPQCLAVTCSPRLRNPNNGFVTCSNDNIFDSICSFNCIEGYELLGTPTARCLDMGLGDSFGDWSDEAPRCERISCHFPLFPPTHGSMNCSDGVRFSSACSITCDEGYHMLSSSYDAVGGNIWTSLCRSDGKWSESEPSCELIYCDPRQTAPRYGEVLCTDGNNYNSKCEFTCNPGYKLSKPKAAIVCLDDGNGDGIGYWSDVKPKCLSKKCSTTPVAPENGEIICSDGINYMSVCISRCDRGFYQTTASGEIVKTNDYMMECLAESKWSRQPPVCKSVQCQPGHSPPTHGKLSCTRGVFYKSVCSFSCNPGFDLEGKLKSICEEDGSGNEQGEWSSPAPICSPISCRRMIPPVHSTISCTDVASLWSVCTIYCDDGYYMIEDGRVVLSNTFSTTCGPGRRWSGGTVDCRPITCSPSHRFLAHGTVSCTNKNFYQSLCYFTCNEGYRIEGAKSDLPVTSYCGEDDVIRDERGTWTTELAPTCEPGECESLSPPAHGSLICSKGRILRSVCSFFCDRGYYMTAADTTTISRNVLRTTCVESLTWNQPSPTCQPIVCSLDKNWRFFYNVPSIGGSVTCTNSNFYKSICIFSCDSGFEMKGRPKTVCDYDNDGDTFGTWTHGAPSCKRNSCDPNELTIPGNGRRSCTNRNLLDSLCSFICDRFHTRNGPARSKCVEGADGPVWSDSSPTCEPDVCTPQKKLKYGVVACSRENRVMSVCVFKCTAGYVLYPRITRIRCLPTKRWDKKPPCCTVPCPPSARMDVYVIVQSSSDSNWLTMTSLIKNLLRSFTVSNQTGNFAIVRYNKFVDTKTQIHLNDYPDSRTGLLAAFSKFSYKGSGVKTGQALAHVRDVMMLPENGNRPGAVDVVFVATEAKSQDDAVTPARDLREKGAHIFVIGYQPPIGTVDYDELVDIAGDGRNVYLPVPGFVNIDDSFGKRFASKVCEPRCKGN